MTDGYQPPFRITEKILNLVAEISKELGYISPVLNNLSAPHLRRENRIKTIHSSLAIEQNSLTLDQVSAILEGKRVFGPVRDIQEVKNAIAAYDEITKINPLSQQDLFKIHGLLIQGTIEDTQSGRYRTKPVGIIKSDGTVAHIAPPAHMVSENIQNLFSWYKNSKLNPLVKSAAFHYEFEFIHPFLDGNGRMGRYWHTALLGVWNPVFYWLPVEELIQRRMEDYYAELGKADRTADSTGFIELMLEIILDTLVTTYGIQAVPAEKTPEERLLEVLGENEWTSAQIMGALNLSSKAYFRKHYINPALESGLIEMTIPDKPRSSKQKYRKNRKK